MLMDLPPAVVEQAAALNASDLEAAAQIASSLQHIAAETWSRETLTDILNGTVAIPDADLNQALTAYLGEEQGVSKLQVASHEDRHLDVYAKTKRWGVIALQGTLDELVHNREESRIVYSIEKRSLKDNKAASWIFQRLSLSLLEKLFGKMQLADDIPVSRQGHTLSLDLRQHLASSAAASYTVGETSLLDVLTINGATPHEGYIELHTSLQIPDTAKTLLQNLLQRENKVNEAQE